ncbi:nucleoside phosphorylase domain-containing protein [Trichoderma barbatum]
MISGQPAEPRDSDPAEISKLSKPPSSRQDYRIAIICALPLECRAITLLFDQFWDEEADPLGQESGDTNTYITGRMGTHYVVLVLIPSLGKASMIRPAAFLRRRYPDLSFAILMGICGGVPNPGAGELLLGDVVISKNVIRYDSSEQYLDILLGGYNHLLVRRQLRTFLAMLEGETGNDRLQRSTAQHLNQLQRRAGSKSYSYPGFAEDRLFEASYRHKHWGNSPCEVCNLPGQNICDEAAQESCAKLGCDASQIVRRERLEEKKNLRPEKAQRPAIFTGDVASGDAVLKSGDERDRIAKELGVIAFDMHESGLSEGLPCVIIKGICDYADGHKNKKWQPFAAATAAAAAKALLEQYYSQLVPPNIRNLIGDLRMTDLRVTDHRR